MTLIESLERQHGFTKTDVSIADYIRKNLSEVSNMTIVQLAEATYSSRSSVLRLCRKLGCEGFRDFRFALARELARMPAAYDVDPNQPFEQGARTTDIVNALGRLFHQAVDETSITMDVREVRKAGRLVVGARHVALYGVGDTMASLEVFSTLLLKSGVVCVRGYDGNDRYAMGGFLGPEDVAVLASYSGINLPEFERQLAGPLARRCKVILLTSDSTVRERMLGADCVICLPARERHENQGAYYSQGCMRFALSCIYGEVVSQTWETTKAVRERVLLEDEEQATRKREL